MRPPTPETISIITTASGSTRICADTLKLPPVSQVYAVETCERSCGLSPHMTKKATAAAPKATNVESVEIQPASRREIVCPQSAVVTQPTSGASRQTQAAAVISASASERAHPVDVEREAAARHRDDQPQPDRDLTRRDRHHREREHLPVEP